MARSGSSDLRPRLHRRAEAPEAESLNSSSVYVLSSSKWSRRCGVSGASCLIHAAVRCASNVSYASPVRRVHAHADAGAQSHGGVRSGVDGGLAMASCRSRRLRCAFGVGAARQHQNELVPRVTNADVVRPDRGAEHACDLTQRAVAAMVPMTVVDQLEVIEVDDEEGELRAQRFDRASSRVRCMKSERVFGSAVSGIGQ